MGRTLALLACLLLGFGAGDSSGRDTPETGDLHGVYVFPPTGETMPYRLYVPSAWDKAASLPFKFRYLEVDGNDGSMVPMVWPEVFAFFDSVSAGAENVTNGVPALFDAWKATGKPAEIHIYDGVSAGFGLSQRGRPVDSWIERFYERLGARELTTAVESG